jgi:hypothetical protein
MSYPNEGCSCPKNQFGHCPVCRDFDDRLTRLGVTYREAGKEGQDRAQKHKHKQRDRRF